jgi:hypothetical protein
MPERNADPPEEVLWEKEIFRILEIAGESHP